MKVKAVCLFGFGGLSSGDLIDLHLAGHMALINSSENPAELHAYNYLCI